MGNFSFLGLTDPLDSRDYFRVDFEIFLGKFGTFFQWIWDILVLMNPVCSRDDSRDYFGVNLCHFGVSVGYFGYILDTCGIFWILLGYFGVNLCRFGCRGSR